MKSILIICHSFPPLNNVASGRPYSWALHFHTLGYSVKVLTTKKQKWNGNLDYKPFLPDDIEIMETPWVFNGLEKSNKIIRKISRMLMGFSFANKAKDLNIEFKNSLIISTFEPGFAHIAAYLIKKKNPKSLWLADYRDGWTTNHLDRNRKFFRNFFERMIEKHLLKNADAITSVSKGFLNDLLPLCQNKIPSEVIYNGFFPPSFQAQSIKNLNTTCTVSYIGTRYKYQNPKPLLSAIQNLYQTGIITPHNFQFNFIGEHGDLEKLVSEYQIKEFFNFPGWLSRKEAQKAQKESDLLLFLDWESEISKGVLPAKIYEYISSSTPILFLGSEKSEAAEILHNTQTGIICINECKSIKSYLQKLPELLKKQFHPNPTEINFFLRNNQSSILTSFLKNHNLL